MRATELVRRWDARWTPAEQDEAVRQADQQAAQARIDIDAAIRAVEAATEGYSDAMKWTVSVRSWRDDARAVASREKCPNCHGTGEDPVPRQIGRPCPRCDGSGESRDLETTDGT